MSPRPPLNRTVLHKTTLSEPGSDHGFVDATPEDRPLMGWPLTLAAWSLKDPHIAESRLQRDVVRIIRGGR